MKKLVYLFGLLLCAGFVSCSDDDNDGTVVTLPPSELPDWYYAGGRSGTAYLTTAAAFEQPTAVIDDEDMYLSFKRGEALFENPFMTNNEGVRKGLGPVYIRTSCIHCHPGYGHGKRIPDGTFNTNEIGNGCLLVVYNKDTEGYVTWLAGMPQSHAVAPFKAPVDESMITVTWKNHTDEWNNEFPDGEKYELIYPEVNMPKEAVYVYNQDNSFDLGNYGVKLESTIGIYGTGLLDAISDEDLKEEWAKQEELGVPLNTTIFQGGDWAKQYANSAQGGDGTKYPLRYTYAMIRGPLQDGAGANAFWNITNATRSDRRFHYLDGAGSYAKYSSKDPEVQAAFGEYISKLDPNKEHPEWHVCDTLTMEQCIYNYLTSKTLPVEVSDQDYIDLMVWHRGLAVPAVRNVDDSDVLNGKELFTQIGCATCHRPSWKTGDDVIRDPANFFTEDDRTFKEGRELPRYPNETIWPYTDMVQHKLYMVNDIRTGWCRTTPLWGRGLHQKCTGSPTADRLHDCRARNVIEAIMWHGARDSHARESVENFRKLKKEERDAVVKFIDSI